MPAKAGTHDTSEFAGLGSMRETLRTVLFSARRERTSVSWIPCQARDDVEGMQRSRFGPAGCWPRGFAAIGDGAVWPRQKKMCDAALPPRHVQGWAPFEPLPPPSLRASPRRLNGGCSPPAEPAHRSPLARRSLRWARPWNELMPSSGPERSPPLALASAWPRARHVRWDGRA